MPMLEAVAIVVMASQKSAPVAVTVRAWRFSPGGGIVLMQFDSCRVSHWWEGQEQCPSQSTDDDAFLHVHTLASIMIVKLRQQAKQVSLLSAC